MQNSRFNATNANQTQTPTATHSNANRQRNSTCATHQQNPTKSTQGHGHAFPLATVPQRPRSILLLLTTWNTDLADYFTKHHPATHHWSVRPTILTAVNNPKTRKLFETQSLSPPWTQRAQIMKVPTKTSVTTTSFVKTLFQTPKFQNT